MFPNKNLLKSFVNMVVSRSKYFELENKRLIILPLQIIAAIVVIAGAFALMFEVTYFAEFSFDIYFGRLIATGIGFLILVISNFEIGQKHPTILIHVLLLTIIASFASIIITIPESLYINSHLLALVLFTSALFLNWDLKNQIIVAIYYNILFASSILLTDKSIYFLPSMYASVVYVIIISLLSIVASSINYRLRQRSIEKTFEARDFFENSTEALFKASIETLKINTVNPSFLKLFEFGKGESDLKNYIFSDIFSTPEEFEKFSLALEADLYLRDYAAKLKTINNQEFIASLIVRISDDISGQHKFIEGSVRDITSEKLAEEKIKKYSQELKNLNDSKDKFFSIVAHDLISPFSAVIGYSEILASEFRELELDQIGQFASDINSISQKAHNLLSELLDWSRIQTGRMPYEPQKVQVHSLANDLGELYFESLKSKNLSLVNKINPDHLVIADYKMVGTILRNLISNAIKFSHHGGKVSVTSTRINEKIQFCVEDEGIGIKQSDIDKLFKIDVHHTQIGTGQEKGTGLGLILCKELVKKNNGDIWVESEDGRGAKFIFTLMSA
ncbi:MAG: PAS domain S-box protein [Melioribacteraceae bacterium]|nr:PAS domain S-box protein [Melioribacteraceae bacterium]